MLVQGKYLFPLSKIEPRLTDYYMDAEFRVMSTKGKQLYQLSGSRSGCNTYFTLNSRSYRGPWLKHQAMTHSDFKKETSVVLARILEQGAEQVEGKRSYAASLAQAITLRGVMIAQVVDGDKLLFGSDPKFHTTEQSFTDEMQRLALLKPGKKFVAVKIIKSVVAGEVSWS